MILLPVREQLTPFSTDVRFALHPVGETRLWFASDLHSPRESHALMGGFRRCPAPIQPLFPSSTGRERLPSFPLQVAPVA